MLMPTRGNENSWLSKTVPEPNAFDVHHSASRTFTTNQPSATGTRPEPESSSRASGTARVYGFAAATATRRRDGATATQTLIPSTPRQAASAEAPRGGKACVCASGDRAAHETTSSASASAQSN